MSRGAAARRAGGEVSPAMGPSAGAGLPGRCGWRRAERVEGGMAPMCGGWSRPPLGARS